MNQSSNAIMADEGQMLCRAITAPAEGLNKLLFIIRLSYAIDLMFLIWASNSTAVSEPIVFRSPSFWALGLLLFGVLLRGGVRLKSSENIVLMAVRLKPNFMRTLIITSILAVFISVPLLFDLSFSLVHLLIVAMIAMKLSELFIQLLPGPQASPVAQLNSAAKLMILLEFLPILIGRAAMLPIFFFHDVSSGAFVTVVAALLVGLGLLSPKTQSFLGTCSTCYSHDHRLIIRAFGTCCACKRLFLANNRS